MHFDDALAEQVFDQMKYRAGVSLNGIADDFLDEDRERS
jgi:hypothetical protein